MLRTNDLSSGTTIFYEGAPFEVISTKHSHIGRGGATVEVRLRNLKTGMQVTRVFRSNEEFEEIELERSTLRFLSAHRGNAFFLNEQDKKLVLSGLLMKGRELFFKKNMEVTALKLDDEVIAIELPIKVVYEVQEAPPGVKGNTAQGGTKPVVIETGATVNTPLFIETGDTIVVNTQTGEYVERAK